MGKVTSIARLPTIPRPEGAVDLNAIEALGSAISNALTTVDDLATLQLWRSQTAALAAYLRGKELHLPMRAAQHKVEARIGQLLIATSQTRGRKAPLPAQEAAISQTDRYRFRALARGLANGLTEEDWRQPRDVLIASIMKRFPAAPRVSTTVDKRGKAAKPLADRVDEIRELAAAGMDAARIANEIGTCVRYVQDIARWEKIELPTASAPKAKPHQARELEIQRLADEGMRAAQIGAVIGVSAERVRYLAKRAAITLADTAIGRPRRLDAVRILTETINGIDAYVSGLTMLDGAPLPAMPTDDATELMQSLMRSLNGLKKLRTRMEDSYARPNHPAT